MNELNELIRGAIGGILGTVICQPLDTIKTHIQSGHGRFKPVKIKFTPTFLYRGMMSPLIGIVFEKSTLFCAYDFLKKNTSLNNFQRGIVSGFLTTLTITPFERVKINAQIQQKSSLEVLKNMIKGYNPFEGMRQLYKGWTTTLIREVPGFGVYFWTYENIKKYNLNSFLTGSIIGSVSWLAIYPSDCIKTHIQSTQSTSILQSIRHIYHYSGILGFYRGLPWALLRAAVFHGGVIYGYEHSKF